MAEVSIAPGQNAAQGLVARAVGIIVSPRDTFLRLIPRPRILGALLVVSLLGAVLVGGFLMTDIGKRAWLDQAVTSSERWTGQPVSDQQYTQMEKMSGIAAYLAIGQMLIGTPLMLLVLAGILFAVFNAVMGGAATFKQLYSVIVHSTFVWVVGWIFVLPMNYMRETMSSPTNLSVLFPMLEEGTFLNRLLGSVDVFMLWWVTVLAIGVGVLYRRRTQPILLSFLSVYGVIAIAVAAYLSRGGSR
jgi:hypothetical protein